MQHFAWPWLLTLAAFLHPSAVTATALRLTIDEAVTRAVAANPDFNAGRKDVDLAAANLERSRVLLPSNPYFSGGAQRTTAKGVGSNYVFLLSQEIEIAGQRKKRIAAATQNVERATWQVRGAEQSLAATVRTAFIHALVSADRVIIAEQAVDLADEFARQLPRPKQASEVQRIDMNTAQIQQIRAQRELAGAKHARESALRALRYLVGLPIDQDIELAGAPRDPVDQLPAVRRVVEQALQQRADLAAFRHNAQRANLQLAVSRRERVPNITLSATVSRFEGDTLTGGDIGFPLPIFQRKTAEVQEAIAERERSDLQVQDLERTIEQEVLEAHSACALAAADLQSLRHEIMPKSEENYELERQLYERAAVGLSDLLTSRTDLLSTRREHLDALEAYNTALIELERAAGGPIAGP